MEIVNVCLGRFQPFTIGHFSLVMAAPNEYRTVILCIEPNEQDERHPFSKWLTNYQISMLKMMYGDHIAHHIFVKSADICAWGAKLKELGFQAKCWLCGSDNIEAYSRMASKVGEYQKSNKNGYDCDGAFTDDFQCVCLARDENSENPMVSASGTKARQLLKEGKLDEFEMMLPIATRCLSHVMRTEYHHTADKSVTSATPVNRKFVDDIVDDVTSKIKFVHYDFDYAYLGSTGKREVNGDVDLAITIPWEEHDKIMTYLTEECGYDKGKVCDNINTINVGVPYYDHENGHIEVAQVDIMFTQDLEFTEFCFHSPCEKDSKFKGMWRTQLMIGVMCCLDPTEVLNAEADEPDTYLKMSFTKVDGLKCKTMGMYGVKGQLLKTPKVLSWISISKDPKEIVKLCFGEQCDIENDLDSYESILRYIKSDAFPYRSQELLDKVYDWVFNNTGLLEKSSKETIEEAQNLFKS